MWRNIAGGLTLLATTGLIGYAVYVTKEPSCLWAIILLIPLIDTFPWAKE